MTLLNFITENPALSIIIILILSLFVYSITEMTLKTIMWVSALHSLAKMENKENVEDFVRESLFKKVDKNEQK